MSKVMGILANFGFLTIPAHQIWSCHVTQDANFENLLFCPNSTFNPILDGVRAHPILDGGGQKSPPC